MLDTFAHHVPIYCPTSSPLPSHSFSETLGDKLESKIIDTIPDPNLKVTCWLYRWN